MAINGSDFVNNPWDTTWGVFTDIFGGAFWLIPIGLIAVALYVKTREVTVSSVWLIVSCVLVGSTVFASHPEIGFVYYVFAVFGLVGTIVSIFLMEK